MPMEEEKKFITKRMLLVILAKWIKKQVKKEKFGEIPIDFRFLLSGDITAFQVGVKWVYVNGSINPVDIVQEALNETRYNGIVFQSGIFIQVLVYGKPSDEFKRLTRIVYRLSGITIKWNDVVTQYIKDKRDADKYLCYNDMACESACNFLKHTRKARNKILVAIREEDGDVFKRVLDMSIIPKSGKEKYEKTISV